MQLRHWTGAVIGLAFVVSAAYLGSQPGGTAAAPISSPPRKITVDSADRATLAELPRLGGTHLADYGSFSLWSVPADRVPALERRSSVAVRDDWDTIELRSTTIHTPSGAALVPAALEQVRSPGPQFWMLQFVGPVKDEWLAEVAAQGLQIVSYVPNNAYVVWGDGVSLDNLDALAAGSPIIQWTGAYHPAYRLEPTLQQAAAKPSCDDLVDVTVQFYNTEAVNQSVARLQALGGQVHQAPSRLLNFTTISLQLPTNQLIPVAHWADVYNVEPWVTPQLPQLPGGAPERLPRPGR